MPNILIVGGGFAGVWAALAASEVRREANVPRSDLEINLIAPRNALVIRPRLYEPEPEKMTVELDRVLAPIGVDHTLAAVAEIDTEGRRVVAASGDGERLVLPYDRLVLAAGSRLVRPRLLGSEHVHDVDTLETAIALDQHLTRLPETAHKAGRFTAVVVGAGFTGIEVATELVGRLRLVADRDGGAEVRVILVERAGVVGPDLGAGPRPEIVSALGQLGVELRLETTLAALDDGRARLSDGSEVETQTVVWTAGLEASPLTAEIPAPRDGLGRLEVDQYQRVAGVPAVYAAGDTAAAYFDAEHRVLQSCQHAIPQGTCAGHNAAAELCGLSLEPFAPNPYVTCLDLGSAGAVLTRGWERTVEQSGEAAKAIKRKINTEWIYPPLGDAREPANDDLDDDSATADHPGGVHV